MPSTGTPASKISCGARGDPASSTDSGPPERITPFGFIAAKAVGGLLIGHDLGIDALLAHPPRDQLGHLRAEIDDQDLVVHAAGRRCRLSPRSRGSCGDVAMAMNCSLSRRTEAGFAAHAAWRSSAEPRIPSAG